MKKQTGIWIDGSRAIFVSLNDVVDIASEMGNQVYHDREGFLTGISGKGCENLCTGLM